MKICRFLLLAALMALTVGIKAQDDALKAGFVTPPQAAKPRVWWHWMNGNISKEGIRKDLLWMDRVGLGGVHIFDAGKNTPQVVPHRIVYMTDEWKDCYAYAVRMADSLGMEATMLGTPGWSHSGGPWVQPRDAMKKLVWRQMVVTGGKRLSVTLPEPYRVSGAYQDVKARGTVSSKTWYEDIAVLAVPVADDDLTMQEMGAQVTASGGKMDLAQLTDGRIGTATILPADTKGKNTWVQFALDAPYTVRALAIADGRIHSQFRNKRPAPLKWLEASDDGTTWRKVCDIVNGAAPLLTITIKPTTARYFRVVFKSGKRATQLAELVLYTVPKVNHSEEKAGFGTPVDIAHHATPEVTQASKLEQVIDLTDRVDSLGRLQWQAPKGRWRIYRFGYSLTGKMNHPASPEATGLEVDKLDGEAVDRYLAHYLPMFEDASAGRMGAHGLQALLVDSYEAGIANWTSKARAEFGRRRGYDMRRWMPALAGEILESAQETDRFLFDWRKTLGELMAENLYGKLADTMRAKGMQTYYESHETCRVMLSDGMDIKRNCDIPMGAMWASLPVMGLDYNKDVGKQSDCKETSSAAHLYGRPIVAAESMTCGGLDGDTLAYSLTPERLKPVADLEMACGINRFVIHNSTHQPVDDKVPGQGLEIYGIWFHRHAAWAEQARPWVDYLSRSSYMLQQGKWVADVAYYYGEDANVTGLFHYGQPQVPPTASFDYVSSHALTTCLQAKDGGLTTPDGVRYRMIALDDNATRMTLPVLRHLASLVEQGVPLCGNRPVCTPSLSDDQAEWQRLVGKIWDSGRTNVYVGKTIDETLRAIGVRPDLYCDDMDSLRFVHRTTPDAEIYWVNNRRFHARTLQATFRVTGMIPCLWHPETGKVSRLAYREVDGGTQVSLTMQPMEAYFVVFRQSVPAEAADLPATDALVETKAVEGPWTVRFQPGRGAPDEILMDTLASLTQSPVPGVRYFAGTATYTHSQKFTRKQVKEGSIRLDLGQVAGVAEVYVNGQRVGELWHAPFVADISGAVRPGNNAIEVRVAVVWRNRLIGDKQPDSPQAYGYTSYPFFKATTPLHPSGLIGPVLIKQEQKRKP